MEDYLDESLALAGAAGGPAGCVAASAWRPAGGGFDAAGKDLFLSSYRNLQPPDTRATTIGFRIVLAVKGVNLEE